jgi:hypothetical protein
MGKILKIGWILCREGVITREQLENIVAVQAKHPDRSIGEITADLFAIAEDEIESVFANHILAPVIEEWFRSELTDKLPGLALDTIISGIEVQISRFTRSTIIRKEFVKGGKKMLFQGVAEKKYLFNIHCVVDTVTIRPAMGQEIVFHDLAVEYDVQSQRLKVDHTSVILEAKIKILQQLKGGGKG